MKAMDIQGVHLPVLKNAAQFPERIFLSGERPVCYREAKNWISYSHSLFSGSKRAAIWMEKGTHYALSILSAMCANVVYVPVDGNQPVARVLKILQDSQVDMLVTDNDHLAKLLEEKNTLQINNIIIVADKLTDEYDYVSLPNSQLMWPDAALSFAKASFVPEVPNENDIAAILYTSGSTGTPKGVQFTHGNLSNFIGWSLQTLAPNHADHFLNISSFNFDISTFDLFVSLSAGASLYITSSTEQRSVAVLYKIIREQKISVIYTVPSLLCMMDRAGVWQMQGLNALKYIIFAGEVMPVKQLRNMINKLPDSCMFFNFYGPTETNVCLYHQVDKTCLPTEILPIGRTIANTSAWLEDENGFVISPDSQKLGEIIVSGACVTAGYFNRRDKANYINHTMGRHATGDLGSYKGANLIYHGRRDRMIKHHGYRVELGEIEFVINQHPDIVGSAVLYCPDSTRIRVYAKLKKSRKRLTITDCKIYCAKKLPQYMIPHEITILREIPKNQNGKTDYKALSNQPEPELA